MFFGTLPPAEAEGAILAHSQEIEGRTWKKGTRLSAEDVAALSAAGVTGVVVARLDAGDLDEDTAASRLADACIGPGLERGTAATGRVNLFAKDDGLLLYERANLDSVNLVSEALTLAAMEPYARVETGQLVATIKVIPLAVSESDAIRAVEAAKAASPLLQAAPFRPHRAGLLQTILPGTRDKVLSKSVETVAARLESLGSTLHAERRVAHEADAIAGGLQALQAEGCDLLLILGASVTTDRRDAIPSGIADAGGTVEHYGMPVDPGNLLVTARLGRSAVLALPGSARSPKTGGNDWVLWRLCAGLDVTPEDIMRMGAGGLLKEIPARPLPRAKAAPKRRAAPSKRPRIAALVLAAGQSRRMGTRNKLLEEVEGKPLLLKAVDAALQAQTGPIVVVTGHARETVEGLLKDRAVTTVHNPDHAEGLSTSLRCGLKALPEDADGVLVLLGDMPGIRAEVLDRLIAAFDPSGDASICVPAYQGKRGNPVLFARRYFPEMREISGDMGAKPLLSTYADQIAAVEMPDEGVLIDLDTPESLEAYRDSTRRS